MLSLFALCLLGGSAVGILNGMLGIGGAVIIIPLLDEILLRMGLDPAVSHVMAIGTSPSTILFTCIAGLLVHRRLGSMRDDILLRMAPGIFVGAVLGAFLAPMAPTLALKLLYYGILVVICGQGAFPMKRFEREKEDLRWIEWLAVFFGILASMSGVAGTMLCIAFLNWRGVPWAQTVGTGAGTGFIVSLTATIGYISSGWGVPDLPAWSVGYVYLPGMLCLIIPSMFMARVGARLVNAKRMPVEPVKRVVCFMLMLMSVWMIFRLISAA